MLRNYFTTGFRSLWKNKFHSLINIGGLTLGIASSIVIFMLVRFELSFDSYHDQPDRIARVITEYNEHGETSVNEGLPYPLAEAMRQDFPDLEYTTITDTNSGAPVMGVDRKDGTRNLFKEEHAAFADPDYFKMFKYVWIAGDPADGLSREKTVVLAASVARKYFGGESAMGRIISYNGKYDLIVSGVVEDPPQNTDLPFTVIISNRLGADKHGWDTWTSSSGGVQCYVRLKSGYSMSGLEKKMEKWHLKYFTGNDAEEGKNRRYRIQPLTQLHFDTRLHNFNKTMSRESLAAFALIGGLLLMTACINFINLNTVLIVNRAREVGVRKVMGSGKSDLVLQFLGETFLIALIALIISLPLTEFCLINMDTAVGYNLKFYPVHDGALVFFICAVPFVVTLLAGLYPALSLARFQPILALKNKVLDSGGGINMRRCLIGFQLMISQALVICTIVVAGQMNFFMNKPLGLNSSAMVEFDLPENSADFARLKERMEQIPGVNAVTMSNTGATFGGSWGGGFEANVNGRRAEGDAQVKFTDVNFINTYQLTLIAGRDRVGSDSAGMFIANEAFVRALGIQNPDDAIGVPVTYWSSKRGVIQGVVKDFHSSSLREAISPVLIMGGSNFFHRAAVRLDTKDVVAVMAAIEKEWERAFPRHVFQYGFLDDTIRNFYTEERQTSRLIATFATVAVLIGCIGLLGLVSFMVTKRTKEVGIRKILGASISSIMRLFSFEFMVLIIVSCVIATPAAIWIMQQWLSNFAFHITPGFMTAVSGLIVSSVVVMVTVGSISWRAARANPVNALRDE